MDEFEQAGKNRIGVVAIALGIVGFALVALFFYEFALLKRDVGDLAGPKPVGAIEAVQLQKLYNLAEGGDYAAASREAEEGIALWSEDTVAGQRARSVKVTADFWSGEKEKRLDAVRATKVQLQESPGTPYNQALFVNRLLSYMTTAMEPEIIDEIFSGEFASMRVPGDDVASLGKLAEYSLSKDYTNLANFKVGIVHAAELFKHFDGVKQLSSAELAEYVSAIRKVISETSSHLEEEERRMYGRPYWELQAPAFYYFQGFLRASIALAYPEYLPSAKEALRQVEQYYRDRRTESGGPNKMIEARVVYTNFSLATFMYAIEGEQSKPQVQAALQTIIDLVEADPEAHKGAFLTFMRQTLEDGPDQPKGRWYSYGRFVQMADLYPPFKQFLNSYGWDLE
ncbi:MAG: hypothetical protein HYS26_01385 [Candidatus Kaiserbacteria bacterium]|nr:MAG: hypothetical protein HYS26_01385 [Candidatus Kaiserbacteria bacterium]